MSDGPGRTVRTNWCVRHSEHEEVPGSSGGPFMWQQDPTAGTGCPTFPQTCLVLFLRAEGSQGPGAVRSLEVTSVYILETVPMGREPHCFPTPTGGADPQVVQLGSLS